MKLEKTLHDVLKSYADMIENGLKNYLPDKDCLQSKVIKAMEYSLLGGGKRIRPFLTLEFCRVCGGSLDNALPFACAVEMIHTYSLIHDDLPCMDNDGFRRGKPSCHITFGEDAALLAGDALLTLAFDVMLNKTDDTKVNPQNILKAAGELSRAAGVNGMVGGQMIDIESEGKNINRATLDLIHKNKTGALITAAAKMGTIIAGAGDEKTSAAEKYAKKTGLVFQIIDDVLDVTSTSKKLGKPVGSDVQNQKTTYATLFGVEESLKMASGLTEEAIADLSIFGEEAVYLTQLAKMLLNREA